MESPNFERDDKMLEERRLRRLEKKRRRRLQQRIVLGVLIVILILTIVLIARGCQSRKDTGGKPQSVPVQNTPTAQIPDAQPDTVITLAAVGDIMVYDEQIDAAKQADGSYDFSDSLSAVSALTMGADLTVGNLELNFCGEPYSGRPDFRAPEALALALKEKGFDLVQTANTYSIQNGVSGLKSTIKYLNTVGIDHVGTYAAKDDKETNDGVLLKNVNGIKIAFIAYTKGLNNISVPEGSEYCVDLLYKDYDSEYKEVNKDAIVKSVKAAKALSPDLIVAMLHWGSEWDTTVVSTQDKITDLLLTNGVDIILGSHPHVVGEMKQVPVTTVDGQQKTCFVAYSLGNFLSSPDSQKYDYAMESLILNLQITKNGSTGETALTGISYTPLYILKTESDVEGTRYQVVPIRSAINNNLFPEMNDAFTAAIAHLRTNTASDYDSGK